MERYTPAPHSVLPAMQGRGQAVDTPRLPARMGDGRGPLRPMEGTGQGEDPRKARKVYTWTCQYCGQPFESSHYGKRYCSNAHKQAAYRERQHAEV